MTAGHVASSARFCRNASPIRARSQSLSAFPGSKNSSPTIKPISSASYVPTQTWRRMAFSASASLSIGVAPLVAER